nr:hypothetical protein [Tanacetum cinerariifolium]
MRRQGKDFSGRVTPLFETMLIQHPAGVDEESGQPTDPQHTSTSAQPFHEESITIPSSSQPKKTQKPKKTNRKATKISQSSGPTTLVADETVHKERGDRVERAVITASSLEVEQDSETQGRYGYDTKVNTTSTSITTASINITTAEPVTTINAPVTTVGVSISTAELSTPPPTTTTTGIEDEDLIIAQTLMKIRSEKSKENSSETTTRPTRGVIMKEASETTRRVTIPPQQQLVPKDKGKGKLVKPEKPLKKKDQIEFDKEVAQTLQAQKKHFARLRAEEKRRKSPTKAQKRNQMCTYLKNIAGFTHNRLKNKSFEELQKDFNKTMSWINSLVHMDSEVMEGSGKEAVSKKRTRKGLDEESVKRQKLKDDAEKEELKACLEIVLNDDKVINIETLATKSPTVDWEA